MSQPYDPEEREQAIAQLTRAAFQRVVLGGDTPREAVDYAADCVDVGLVEYGRGDREDAVARVEEATVDLLERVAERLEDVDVEDGGQV